MHIQWKSPPSVKIVVLDGGGEVVANLLPLFSNEAFVVIESQGMFRYLTLELVLQTAGHFLQNGGSLKSAYAAALVRCIKPRIVVTFIDNSLLFQQVAKTLHYSMRFLAIQNGVRMLTRDNLANKPRIFYSEFACLGQRDVDQYTKHGAEVGHYYPIGSLKDAYYRSEHAITSSIKRFDLCLISQIKRQHYQHYPKTMQSLELLASHLKRFCAAHDVKLCVAARRHPSGNAKLFAWESAWFREHLGEHVEIIPNASGEYTSYATVDQSRVSLALHTTLLHEAFGRGSRILSCNFTGDSRYDFSIPGPWSLTDPAYAVFEQCLLNLLNMSDAEYDAACGDSPHYLIGYDARLPTHVFLQKLIAEAVHGAPAPFTSPVNLPIEANS